MEKQMTVYLPYRVNSGQVNMDKDAQILNSAIESGADEPVFRLYGWNPPCISLGRNQRDDFLDMDFLKIIISMLCVD